MNWYTFPAQLKAVIDKFASLFTKADAMYGKKCALISVAAETSISVFDGTILPYIGIYENLKWESVGQILIPGVMDIGDVEKTDGVNKVIELAGKF